MWLAAVCRPPEQGSVHASSTAFEKVDVDRFVIRTEPLRPLPLPGSTNSVGCCWLNMFDGGYVLAQGFPVPPRKIGRGIELPLDMMVEQAMTYHTISDRGSIILKGSHTALVPILVDGIETLDQAEEVQWHLIGKKPKLVHVTFADESKRSEGYYLTDVEFSAEDPDLSWEAIDQRALKMLPVKSIQEFSGKRSFVGHFPKAQILLGTKESGFEKIERSNAKPVKGSVMKFGQASIALGTNFSTAGIINMTGGITFRRTRYDNTPKQVPALIGDQLRNRRNRPHIVYDVEKKIAWMIPEACLILYLMHRWASLQEPPSITGEQQETTQDPSSSQQEIPLELRGTSVLEHMPFIGASCDGGKKAADSIWSKCFRSPELPKHIRSTEEPEKPVYVANIVFRMSLAVDGLIEHQKRKKPSFFRWQGIRMWGYELADVAELNEAPAKRVSVDKARSGGWYNLTNPKSEIAILFGNKLGDLIKYEPGQMICHRWKSVPMGYNFLSADGEGLKYLQERLDQRGLSNLFLSNKHSGIYRRNLQQCENKAWPCCNMALQLKPTAPRVIIEVKEGEAVVIGKLEKKLEKVAGSGSQNMEQGRLSETSKLPNGCPTGQASHRESEGDAPVEPEEPGSSDVEYLSCDEYPSESFQEDPGRRCEVDPR